MRKIGITTTVPLEVLLAAGCQPVDLNNVFIGDSRPGRFVTIAERDGFPLNCCSWIKGIYGVCLETGIRDILCVTGGDCSNTIMLMEVLRLRGLNAMPFAYPDRPDVDEMQRALLTLAASLSTTLEAAEKVKEQLHPCRELALKLDDLTWRDNLVSGWENHVWLVSSSDFNGDFHKYQKEIKQLLNKITQRQPRPAGELRLAYIGVPAIYARDLYRYVERYDGRVVFNEIQRQFAMPEPGASLAEQYSLYTYPYSIRERAKDIKAELQRRRIDGIIHYVQAFCHRGIGDIIFRDAFDLPILTIEGNDDFFLNSHIKTRIEAFLDMLHRSKSPGTLKNKSMKKS